MRDAVGSTGCKVFPGMDVEGIMNVVPAVSFPAKLSLVVKSVSLVKMGKPVPAACATGESANQADQHTSSGAEAWARGRRVFPQ